MQKLRIKVALVACGLFWVVSCSNDSSSVGEGSPGPSAGRAGTDAHAAGTGAGGRGAAGGAGSTSGRAGSGAAPASAGAGRSAANGGKGGAAASGGAAGMSSGNPGRPAAGSGGREGGSGRGGSGPAPAQPGEDQIVEQTIVVRAGAIFDGSGKRFIAGRALGDGSQDEDQAPVFKLEAGAHLKNVVLGAPAADGIQCHGDATLENIVWEDIGEDAMTIKEPGSVTLNGGSAKDGDDKVFQINAASTFKVSNFTATNAGKFIRQNGGTTFKIEVEIDQCDISKMDEAIFRTDSSTSTVKMTRTRYSQIGDELFIGVTPANIQTSDNTEY